MPKFTFFILFFFCLSSVVLAQQPQIPDSNPKRPSASDHIKTLKEGALLVRLKTSQNQIDALNKMGKTAWARRIVRDQIAENQKLVDAFKNYYTFSPVYFFYSDDSEKIKQKQFEGILYDVNLKPAFTTDTFQGRFLVAEYGLIGQNQSSMAKTGKRVDDASETSTIEGLVISDENLVQLSDPFPYFVRSFKSLGRDLRRSEDRMVQKLNEKLIRFWKSMSR